MDIFYFDEYWGYNPWRNASEKSQAAERREQDARTKFDGIRQRLEHALVNNKLRMVKLGCKDDASPLNVLPDLVLENIFGFVKPSEFDAFDMAPVRVSKKKPMILNPAAGAAAAPAATLEESPPSSSSLALDINALYEPGRKHIIPLLIPSEHLTGTSILSRQCRSRRVAVTTIVRRGTFLSNDLIVRFVFSIAYYIYGINQYAGPCWRDFSRSVRQHDNWNVVRKAATAQERKIYKESRKGQVYFVNLCYTVPGDAKTTKKKTANKKKAVAEDSKPPAKKKAKTTPIM